jgi:drug/metabolite transporter (DMT)-like permease
MDARRGIPLAVVSAASFGLSGSLATSLLNAGWSTGAAVLVRVGVAGAVLAVPAGVQLRRVAKLTTRDGLRLALFGVFAVAGAQLCYFNAVQHLSVGVALMLEYSGTLLVVGWQWLTTRNRPHALTGCGALLAIIGLTLALGLWHDARVNGVGVLWGLGAAVGLAVYFVMSSQVEATLPPLVTAAGGLLLGAAALGVAAGIGALPLRASRADVILAHTHVSWLVPALGLSLVAAALAYVTGIMAAQRLGATVASFVGLGEVLSAVAFAWLLVGEHLRWSQLTGGALVVAGIALVRLDSLHDPVTTEAQTVDTFGSPELTSTDHVVAAVAEVRS